jgi:hypothetical protein
MLKEKKCAAYFGKWKYLIEKIKAGDLVFLYSNQKGIIARGIATGVVEVADYQGEKDEEYFMYLDCFEELEYFLSAAEIKQITEMNIVFGQTLFTFKDYDKGVKLWEQIPKMNSKVKI